MEDVKLPDLSKLRSVKKRLKDLPSQKSVTDTSNWENRTDTAPYTDKVTKKRKDRDIEYILNSAPDAKDLIARELPDSKKQKRTKKASS